MATLEPHFFENYRCSYLVQDVRITGFQEVRKENGTEAVVREITGCSGARLCKKFPSNPSGSPSSRSDARTTTLCWRRRSAIVDDRRQLATPPSVDCRIGIGHSCSTAPPREIGAAQAGIRAVFEPHVPVGPNRSSFACGSKPSGHGVSRARLPKRDPRHAGMAGPTAPPKPAARLANSRRREGSGFMPKYPRQQGKGDDVTRATKRGVLRVQSAAAPPHQRLENRASRRSRMKVPASTMSLPAVSATATVPFLNPARWS